ncbi:DUF3298 and DUF4163 domain-containing protein [Flagellimonas eckloniae]|uniref:DUF3298 domain-containing protein n=1 Tax=Flagellimonas eckloniae TaxID=346185 RepID=A0A0Q1DP65_9FLAO|nr:DUF3298 and DUF4163 domain-containing protein [Allomuricauda eckloniae]KQC30809.1 hypothetical protein AAY42_13635 [Allomuricauda eckloniae]
MKTPFKVILFLLLTIGCENEDKLTFEPYEIDEGACGNCPQIEISIPKALDKTRLAKTINTTLEEEIIALLSFDEEKEIVSMEDAVYSFTNSYRELINRFPDETIGWEAKVNSEVIYEDKNTISLVFNTYTFTGGAHGYGSTTFLNFDKLKEMEVENWELFTNTEGFEKFAETKFRIQEAIPQDENINTTGFMFDGDVFHLAENIGYTPDGIQLIYNQYEIASYADGPIILTLPYAEANKYLKRKVRL